jgi:hypothetical protein
VTRPRIARIHELKSRTFSPLLCLSLFFVSRLCGRSRTVSAKACTWISPLPTKRHSDDRLCWRPWSLVGCCNLAPHAEQHRLVRSPRTRSARVRGQLQRISLVPGTPEPSRVRPGHRRQVRQRALIQRKLRARNYSGRFVPASHHGDDTGSVGQSVGGHQRVAGCHLQRQGRSACCRSVSHGNGPLHCHENRASSAAMTSLSDSPLHAKAVARTAAITRATPVQRLRVSAYTIPPLILL